MDGLISRLDPSSPVNTGRTYYSFDTRGAVTERLYANGNSYQVDTYDAPGNRSERLLDYSDPWGFGAQEGYYTDLETGLMLCTHRFYDSVVGRFLTRDPSGYKSGINLYGYCKNDSVNNYDSDGYKPCHTGDHTGGNNGGNGGQQGGNTTIVYINGNDNKVTVAPTNTIIHDNGNGNSVNRPVPVHIGPPVVTNDPAPITGPPEGNKDGGDSPGKVAKDAVAGAVAAKVLDWCLKHLVKFLPKML